MLNIHTTPLSQAWVKNVYSLWASSGSTCAQSYTGLYSLNDKRHTVGVQPHLYTQLTTSFAPSLFTVFFVKFNLLITRLYTLSTAPIIKTKEIN